MRANRPIGIFDSGIGGLTVAKALMKLLPNEQIIYFGDTAHLPYGDKSPEAIIHYSVEITKNLIGRDCKLIILACNTASSVAYNHINAVFGSKTPIINVIDPVVQSALENHRIRHIGIIGTKGTIRSNTYENRINAIQPEIKVSSLATPLLVPMIEEGYFDNSISHAIIEAYLNYPDFNDIDALILGCTHYPLIKKEIGQLLKNGTVIVDSTDAIASYTKAILSSKGLLGNRSNNPHHFLVSDFTESFENTTRLFFKEAVHLEHYPIWDL